MKDLVYLSGSSALLLSCTARQWRVTREFSATQNDVAAFSACLACRRRHSVVVLLDIAADVLTLHKLQGVTAWQRWFVLNNLARHSRDQHSLSVGLESLSAQTAATADFSLFREYGIAASFSDSPWYSCLLDARSRLRAIYPVALLAEQFMLPEQLRCDRQTEKKPAVLLCCGAGDSSIRHSFFQQGKLVFIRVLDAPKNAAQFTQQLADTSQHLLDKYSGQHTQAPLEFDCCIAADLLLGSEAACYRVDRNAVGSAQGDCVGDCAERVDDIADGLTVTQLRLFDFFTRQLGSRSFWKKLKPLKLRWPVDKKQQRKTKNLLPLNSADYASVATASRSALVLLSVLLISGAAVLAWYSKTLRSEAVNLQAQLATIGQLLPETGNRAEAMRDLVRLHQQLPDTMLKPAALLQTLAVKTAQSPLIVLTAIEWAPAPSAAAPTAELYPKLRESLSLQPPSNANAGDVLLSVSGYIDMHALSISAAYSAFRGFSASLQAVAGWQLLEAARIPFDSALSQQAERQAGEAAAGFSLLFAVSLHSRPGAV